MKTVRISEYPRCCKKILSKGSEYLWRWNSFDFLQQQQKKNQVSLCHSLLLREQTQLVWLMRQNFTLIDYFLFSQILQQHIAPQSAPFVCNSPVPSPSIGEEDLCWEVHSGSYVESRWLASSPVFFAAGVFSFKYINLKNKSDWWCEGKNIINIVEV